MIRKYNKYPNTIIRKSIFVLLFLLITACHSTANRSDNNDEIPSAWLTKTIKVNLPAAHFHNTFTTNQLLTFYNQGKTDSLLAVIHADKDKLTVIGLSTLGVKLFQITYQGQQIETKQYLLLPQTPPVNQVLSDIMLTLAPIEAWQNVLPEGFLIVERGVFRYLQQNGETIITIQYDKDQHDLSRKPIHITHALFNYQIAIKEITS